MHPDDREKKKKTKGRRKCPRTLAGLFSDEIECFAYRSSHRMTLPGEPQPVLAQVVSGGCPK